jgi:YegS/Rv2252/BmrU family lipid kinase
MIQRVLVVVNPVSGRRRVHRVLPPFLDALRRRGITVDAVRTSVAGDASRLVMEGADAADAIVAAGGDGTLNEVLNGLPANGPPVGLLPTGTANLLARDLRIPFDPEGAAEVVAGGVTVAIDTGVATGSTGSRRFLCTVGLGADAATVQAVAHSRGAALGFRGWMGPAYRTARDYDFPPLRVSVDEGTPEVAYGAVLCNTRTWGGLFTLCPDAHPGDGRFDVCVFRHPGRLAMLRYLWGAWRGTLKGRSDVAHHTGTRFRVEADRPVPAQVDGDPFGETPVEVRIHAASARILVPSTTVRSTPTGA